MHSADFYTVVQNNISMLSANIEVRAEVCNELERFQAFMDY